MGDLKGTYRFVLATEIYGKLSAAKVIKEAALRSGISRGVMQACWDAAGEVIKAWATEGHSVAIPAVADVTTNLISARRVIFTPNVDIKDELASTSINITCYDRNGKEIKKVTSTDGGNVEDPDNKGDNPGGGNTPSGGDTPSGGNPGGGNPSGGGDGE